MRADSVIYRRAVALDNDDDWLGLPLPWPDLAEPRDDLVSFRLRVTLADTRPPVWRQLQIANDLRLSEVHRVVQVAMGWKDTHLHQFQMPARDGEEVAPFLTPFDVEEGDEGVLENDVRLDQVLREPGDALDYLYDYGDDWQHVLELESIHPYDAQGRSSRCLDGARACPPEDCGGASRYQELLDAMDSNEPVDDWTREQLNWLGHWDPDLFYLEFVDHQLRRL